MPFLHHLDTDEASQRLYLRDFFTSVVIKDILKRNAFRDVDLLERIIQYAMANVGTTFSANSVSRSLKSERRTVAPETVMNYLKACEEAFLLIPVPRQDLIGKRILQIQEKYYLADHGIREAVQGTNLRDIERVLENMVCVELLRQGYDVTVGKVGEKEVDFVCDRSGDRLYIQVAYLLASEETIAREFGAFDDIPDHYPRWVLSLDASDMGRNGIRHRNIRGFLGGQTL
jgi:predicted AAA+ superfamily ATPase